MNEQIVNAVNLATIANWVMIIGVAVLVYVSRTTTTQTHRKTQKPVRKVKILN
jgi:hypothetical protein